MPYFVVDECPVTKRSCELTVEALSSHMNGTETVVKAVHCSKHYGAALLSNGRLVLLAQGSPKYHGSIVEHGADNVNDVAAGDTHIVFCKSDGTVYSFGYSNTYGQLGDGTVWASCTREDEPGGDGPPVLSSPQMIRGFGRGKLNIDEGDVVEGKRVCVPIASVACGSHHTLLLTRHGNAVYCCGHGLDGQLGGKRRPALQPSFKSIRLLFGLPIRQVAAAGKHSFVLLQTGSCLPLETTPAGSSA
ncbi:unnamed protein product [Trypanosoma congolense IL3000]|uniref:WGS project CAEQ00000000 data, annotated contig 482 n=1 Tax=Trypanosoma congolense (strain IL3000) TaxID=1068625 RepID=F9WGB1_TRYCI|nr:unnamed protein product [Trypanosoma congolense IL3000]